MHRTARAITTRCGKVEHFLINTLARDGGIAMDDDGHCLSARMVATPPLARINRTLNYRIHNFQMRWIKSQIEVHRAARCRQVGRKSHVVFDITC